MTDLSNHLTNRDLTAYAEQTLAESALSSHEAHLAACSLCHYRQAVMQLYLTAKREEELRAQWLRPAMTRAAGQS